jgi:hypothetical protein
VVPPYSSPGAAERRLAQAFMWFHHNLNSVHDSPPPRRPRWAYVVTLCQVRVFSFSASGPGIGTHPTAGASDDVFAFAHHALPLSYLSNITGLVTDISNDQHTRTLRGPEAAALDRLVRATEIHAAAELFLAAQPPERPPHQGAVSALLLTQAARRRLAVALVASATGRPGGAKQLQPASQETERLLRELPPFPESHRVRNNPGAEGVVTESLSSLLWETALELHDMTLEYSRTESGDHVFTWTEETQETADRLLLEGLIEAMEAMVMSDKRLVVEHMAATWWWTQFAVENQLKIAAQHSSWRMREWSLADRVLPSLGATVAEALPHDTAWTSRSTRQRSLARSFAQSVPGMFRPRKMTARGMTVEDMFDGRRYEVVTERELPEGDPHLFGRLIPRDGGVHVPSSGTLLLPSPTAVAWPEELFALLRSRSERDMRAVVVEAIVAPKAAGERTVDDLSYLTPEHAAELLESYERSGVSMRLGKTLNVPGVAPRAPDEITLAWLDALRARAAQEP